MERLEPDCAIYSSSRCCLSLCLSCTDAVSLPCRSVVISTSTGVDWVPVFLQKEQLQVTDVVVLIDREQGGAAHLAKNGLQLHAAFKLSSMLDILQKHKLVDDELAGKVRTFIAENQTQLPSPAAAPAAPKR